MLCHFNAFLQHKTVVHRIFTKLCMYSTKRNVAVVQVKYGSRRCQVSSMAILMLTCGPITSLSQKSTTTQEHHVLKVNNSMTCLCSIVLDCIEISVKKKKKHFCLKPWSINKAYEVQAFEFVFQTLFWLMTKHTVSLEEY